MKKIFYQYPLNATPKDMAVTAIHFDNTKEVVCISVEMDNKATNIAISIERAMDIGFINLSALNKIL